MPSLLSMGYRAVRRVVVAVVGSTIVLIGVAMLVLPGPALLVIPAGLAVLALEFRWARRLLARAKEQSAQVWDGLRGESAGADDRGEPPPDRPAG
jgi:tellurite resistance protein TerC